MWLGGFLVGAGLALMFESTVCAPNALQTTNLPGGICARLLPDGTISATGAACKIKEHDGR
jgi:hypothetical protein